MLKKKQVEFHSRRDDNHAMIKIINNNNKLNYFDNRNYINIINNNIYLYILAKR